MAKRKKPNLKRMAKRLDDIFRKYIKARDQYCCVACGIHKDSTPQKFLDNSHKISRSNYLLRWCEKNAVALCRRCHKDWGAGITKPQNDAIDRMWGDGTVARLEQFAKQYPYSKGSNLDSVDYRMKLEKFYREKLKCLEEGLTPTEVMKTVWEDFGENIEEV